jgi:hypothetical protein
MIYRGPYFLAVVSFGSMPALSRQQIVFLCVAGPVYLGGGGGALEPNYETTRKLGPL